MATYELGATVERRYPGPNVDAARAAAQPQIDAFLTSGFTIAHEGWVDDMAPGTPIGDAVAAGSLSYLAGQGGSLSIVYRATRPAELPADLPAYTLTDPRQDTLRTWSGLQVVVGVAFVIVFLIVFVAVLSQMTSSTVMPPFGH
jgi:hypothetical protein